MSYTNLSNAIILPAVDYVGSNWGDGKTFPKNHVLTRGAHLLLTPAIFILSAIDTIVGLGVGIGAVCTLGKYKRTCKIAHNHLAMSACLFSIPHSLFLCAINPEAKIFSTNKRGMISSKGDGFLSNSVINPLQKNARACCNSDNFLKRHVSSRLTYALLAISCLVTRAVDGVIAIPAAGLSILTGGKFASLNNLAFRTLQAPMLINDLFYCAIKFINPWTGKKV